VIAHDPTAGATRVSVLSNVRHTYITPPGEGFLPSDTARHHREWAVRIIREAVRHAGVRMGEIDVIAFTKGGYRGVCCGETALLSSVSVLSSLAR
jgi:N6-L-threonylcarbamoyladenine synthase